MKLITQSQPRKASPQPLASHCPAPYGLTPPGASRLWSVTTKSTSEQANRAMKPSALKFLVCPACQAELTLQARFWEGTEVLEGRLTCGGCGAEYPITRGVPRFVKAENYASSFGCQ